MNGRWSRWVFVVEPRPPLARRTPAEITASIAEFARRAMGSADHVHVTFYRDRTFNITVEVPGLSPLDPRFMKQLTQRWQRWAEVGWGDGSKVECVVATPCEEPVRT